MNILRMLDPIALQGAEIIAEPSSVNSCSRIVQ